jgi:hypothetical protein
MGRGARGRTVSNGNAWGWSARATGAVLCVFFALGMATGLSQAGRAFAGRMRRALLSYWAEMATTLLPWRERAAQSAALLAPVAPASSGPVALVKRRDGFYALSAEGYLRGPVQPAGEGDLAILSGPPVEQAGTQELVDYAAAVVHAEAELGEMVSEMRLSSDGTAALFMDRSRTEVIVDLGAAPAELKRAAQVLTRLRASGRRVASLDMTTPGQAVVRLGAIAWRARVRSPGAMRRVAERTGAGAYGGPRRR